jgi:hypothetical protein
MIRIYSILIRLQTNPGKGMMGGYKAFVEMTKRMGQQLYTVQIYKRAHTETILVSNRQY